MQENNSDCILKNIEETGFLAELMVSSELIKKGFEVNCGQTYTDYDMQKSREIDVTGSISFHSDEAGINYVPHLIVEVKKDNKHPWVFFLRKTAMADYMWRILHGGYGYCARKGTIFSVGTMSHQEMVREDEKYATAFCQAFIKNAEYSRIYEALMSSCKASCFFRDNFTKYFNEHFPIKYKKYEDIYLEVFVPLVVVEGTIWEVDLHESGKPIIKESDWIPVSLSYSSPAYLSKEIGPAQHFVAYVTTAKAFPKFVDKFVKWHDGIFQRMNKDVERLRKKEYRIRS